MKIQQYNTLPKTNMKINYVIYGRKSTKPEDRQAASLHRQLQETKRMAEEQGLNVIEEYIDKGTGWIDRSGSDVFYEMIELIKDRKDVKGIICFDSSRLTRNDSDTHIIKKLIINGVLDEIVTVTERFSLANLEYFSFKTQGDFNYSLTVSKNVRQSVKNRIDNGIAPYQPKTGYRYSKEKIKGYKQHVPDGRNFDLMKRTFGLFLTKNYSVAQLYEQAKKMGLKNTRGTLISKTRLYETLKNPYYTGKFLYKNTLYAGNHKAMLTDEEYNLVQEILKEGSKPRQQKHEFALNGFITCKECGMMFTGESHTKKYKNGKTQEFRYYRCTKKGKQCNQSYVKEEELKDQVSAYLSQFEIDEDFFNWSVKWLKHNKKQEEKKRESARKSLEMEHNQVIKRLNSLMDLRLDATDAYDIEEIDDKRRTLKIEKKNIESSLEKLFKKFDDYEELTVKTFDFARRARIKFEKGDLQDKKLVLQGIGSNLTIKDKKLDFQPRNVFLVLKNGLDRLNSINDRLVPKENTVFMDINALQEEQVNCWRGLRNDVRTHWIKNNKVTPLRQIIQNHDYKEVFNYA